MSKPQGGSDTSLRHGAATQHASSTSFAHTSEPFGSLPNLLHSICGDVKSLVLIISPSLKFVTGDFARGVATFGQLAFNNGGKIVDIGEDVLPITVVERIAWNTRP